MIGLVQDSWHICEKVWKIRLNPSLPNKGTKQASGHKLHISAFWRACKYWRNKIHQKDKIWISFSKTQTYPIEASQSIAHLDVPVSSTSTDHSHMTEGSLACLRSPVTVDTVIVNKQILIQRHDWEHGRETLEVLAVGQKKNVLQSTTIQDKAK